MTVQLRARRLIRSARSLKRRARRLAHKARRRLLTGVSPKVRPVRVAVKVLTRRLAGRTGIYILVSQVDAEAVAPLIMDEIHAAARAGVPVELLMLRFEPNSAGPNALARANLPAGVTVRCFWLDAAPNGGGAPPRHRTRGLVSAAIPADMPGTSRTGYFEAGRPVLAIADNPWSTIVDHYDGNAVLLQRDEIDEDSRLVRIIDFNPATGRDAAHRYLDADGRCWLSVWVGAKGQLGRTQQHRPRLREYVCFQAAEAEWVTRRVAGTPRPLILATSDVTEEIAKRVIDSMVATNGGGASMQRIS